MPIPSVIPGQSTSSAILNHSSHKRSRSSTLEIENSRKKNKVEDSLKKRRKRKRRKVSVVVGSPVSSDRAQIMETVLGSPSGQHSHQEDRATESDSPLDSLTASADGSNPASRDVESSLVRSQSFGPRNDWNLLHRSRRRKARRKRRLRASLIHPFPAPLRLPRSLLEWLENLQRKLRSSRNIKHCSILFIKR
jgi:hypothetical protein